MYQIGGTIKETLDAIGGNKFVLPAIQREFVWKPEQIARLFDSLIVSLRHACIGGSICEITLIARSYRYFTILP
jgi:uncharacterized protein with ParB-like and HNH nuclease domain